MEANAFALWGENLDMHML